jgi:hypothetical protein
MYIYYVWVTALLPTYQDGIIAGLVQRGLDPIFLYQLNLKQNHLYRHQPVKRLI